MIPTEPGYVQPPVIPKYSYPLTEQMTYVKKKLLLPLFSHPKSGPFQKPVNAIAEGIYPDYFRVVENPMDLITVRSRLENGWYFAIDPCVADINQVFNNARIYNPPDHVIHQWALELLRFTAEIIKKAPGGKASSPATVKQGTMVQGDNNGAHVVKRGQVKQARPTTGGKRPIQNHQPVPQQKAIKPELSILKQRQMKACQNILHRLMYDKVFHDCSSPFRIISTKYANDTYVPTDLDSIDKKLVEESYANPTEFANDFRKIISETYRFCMEDDPLVDQARELQFHFENMFAKHVHQKYEEEEQDVEMEEDLDETKRLSKVLEIGKSIEVELDLFVENQTKRFEERQFKIAKRRFAMAQSFLNDIESLPEDELKDIIELMKNNGEQINIEEDGSLAIEYSQLTPKTIKQVKRLIDSKKQTISGDALKEDSDVMDYCSQTVKDVKKLIHSKRNLNYSHGREEDVDVVF